MISSLSPKDEQRAEVERHVLALMEHFEAVQKARTEAIKITRKLPPSLFSK